MKKLLKLLFYVAATVIGAFVGGLLLLQHWNIITINPSAFNQIEAIMVTGLQTELGNLVAWVTTVAQGSSSLLGGLGVGFVGGFLLGLKA